MSALNNSNILVGRERKCEGLWSLPSPLTLDDIDFTIEVINGSKKIEFPKAECIKKDSKWYIIVPTAELGAGAYIVVAHYRIPDEDEKHDRIREMYVKNVTDIQINRR